MPWSDDEDDFNPPPYDPFGLLPQSGEGPDNAPAPAPRSGHRFVSDTHWAAAREAYLDGESAASIAARFGMAERTIRARARAEGWRRADQAETVRPRVEYTVEGDPEDDARDAALAEASYADLAERALVQLRRAMARDRPLDAGRWMRVHRRLVDLAEAEAAAKTAAAHAAAKAAEPPRYPCVPSANIAERRIVAQREADAYVASSAVLSAAISARLGPPDLHGLHGSDAFFSGDP